jgi:hypothetical protein
MATLLAVGLVRTENEGPAEVVYFVVEWGIQLLACAVLYSGSGVLTPQSAKQVPDLDIPVCWYVHQGWITRQGIDDCTHRAGSGCPGLTCSNGAWLTSRAAYVAEGGSIIAWQRHAPVSDSRPPAGGSRRTWCWRGCFSSPR